MIAPDKPKAPAPEVEVTIESARHDAALKGVEAGMNDLPDAYEAVADSATRWLAVAHFQLGTDPAALQARERELEAAIRALTAETSSSAATTGTPAPAVRPAWQTVVSIAAAFALAGCGVEVAGGHVTLVCWTVLTLSAVIVTLNATGIRRLASLVVTTTRAAGAAWRRRKAEKRLRRELDATHTRRLDEEDRRARAEVWSRDLSELLMAEYRFHRVRGVRAREMAR
jgi:hypothetical protein